MPLRPKPLRLPDSSLIKARDWGARMTRYETPEWSAHRYVDRARLQEGLLRDLIAVLDVYPGGLRRWSTMRQMRLRAARAGREVSIKFEDEVERVFRAHCSCEPRTTSKTRMFFKPSEKAGEVWAVDRAHALAWLSEH